MTDTHLPFDLMTWRKAHGLSRIKLAAAWGVDRSTIWRWENVGIDNTLLVACAMRGMFADETSSQAASFNDQDADYFG